MARGMGAEWMYREAVDQRRFWTPTHDLPQAWYDAGEPSTLSGDMQTLQDRGASGFAATQATSGTRPGLGVDPLCGLPILTFNGSQDMWAGTVADWKFLHDSTGSTVACVAQFGTSANPNAVYGLTGTGGLASANIGYGLAYDDRSAFSRNDACTVYIGRGVSGNPTVDSVQSNRVTPNQLNGLLSLNDPGNGTGSLRVRSSINGGTFSGGNSVTNAPSTANSSAALGIGNSGTTTTRLIGNIGETIIYKRLFAVIEAEGLQAYQHHRWNRAYLLPATHRFRNRPRLIGEA